ncbi:T9SS-dependent choice-of-anchor J family protein [Epilithonimonas pallida]|uniref:Por secretion system C-terminal sorting domain-containing protein n=1 Tax=Epilithonimonas pallida TaxID=373671 RepID=A0ABY1R493_9FLAO|nr:choice-of-anchor J domain-containing protein [Epilithonimonas pallida]SMP94216.1 Por secretion system C-terminal sorting domain-containing protein [Epilithonimonas pallida]
MKKILLSCFLAFGIVVNAQFVQNFDAGTTTPAGWSIINGGDSNGFVFGTVPTGGTVTAAQSGTNVARITYGATAHDDYLVTPAINVQAGVNDRLSFYVASFSSSFTENYNVMLSTTTATAAAFTTTLKATSKAPAAWTKVTLDLTPYIGQTVYIGFHAVDTDQWYLMFDTIVNDTVPTTVPSCTTATAPADGATNVNVRTTFTWPDAAGASGYKLYLGTTSGGTDILNGVTASSGATLTNNPPLNANTKYYLKIVPTNDVGDATGCTETSFTTGSNPYAPYCGPFTSTTPTQMAPITSFTLNGVTNTSDTSATTFGSYSPNESFTGSPVEVKNNLTTIPFSVTGIASTGNGWGAAVFVDWNEDGDFLDSGESYYNTTATILRTTTVTSGKATLSGNLAIPSGTTLGQKRLRVKYNFTGTTINSPLTTACTDLTNGQVEDYTIDYKSFLAVSDINKAAISVYPNPFKDVLKISDIKDIKSISVNDISGRQVKSLAPSSEINLSNLKEGLYIVNLQMEDGSVKSFKAIKK